MTVSVVFCDVGGLNQINAPAMKTLGASGEEISESGSNQTTTAAATSTRRFARVATDAAVYVSFGNAPNATSDGGRVMLPSGSVEYFLCNVGDIAAVVTV